MSEPRGLNEEHQGSLIRLTEAVRARDQERICVLLPCNQLHVMASPGGGWRLKVEGEWLPMGQAALDDLVGLLSVPGKYLRRLPEVMQESQLNYLMHEAADGFEFGVQVHGKGTAGNLVTGMYSGKQYVLSPDEVLEALHRGEKDLEVIDATLDERELRVRLAYLKPAFGTHEWRHGLEVVTGVGRRTRVHPAVWTEEGHGTRILQEEGYLHDHVKDTEEELGPRLNDLLVRWPYAHPTIERVVVAPWDGFFDKNDWDALPSVVGKVLANQARDVFSTTLQPSRAMVARALWRYTASMPPVERESVEQAIAKHVLG